MNNKILKFFLVVSLMCLVGSIHATHIRAGEIIARRISNLEYQFTFIGYRDVDGVVFGQGKFSFGDGEFYGEGTDNEIPWDRNNIERLGNGVEKWTFTITHSYSAGGNYLVSYEEDFRNDDIQNISGSVSTPFYVETLIVIDALIPNSTPYFTVPPIDQGVVGVTFEHNPGAYDPDGDSLVYYFVTPKQSLNLPVNNYRSLVDASFYKDFNKGNQAKDGKPKLKINRTNGTITWNAPGGKTIPENEKKEFNIAFVVEEWRKINGKYIKLGFVTRDMQIIIWNFKNDPPELKVPNDTCVVVGDTLRAQATATDPDNDPIKMEAYGGPFQLIPKAKVKPNPPKFHNPPAKLNFEWVPNCSLVRDKPYEVQFKATDKPNIPKVPNAPGVVDFETWKIKVLAPPPTGLKAKTISGKRIQLTWDSYSCKNAQLMQVWRKVESTSIDSACVQGMPENTGYELIKVQSIKKLDFLDNNKGERLAVGASYCYRLVALFPLPQGGKSIVSKEACDSILIDAPVITNVDITSTSKTKGKISIKWTPPYQADKNKIVPPYTYELLRVEDKKITSLIKTKDTLFVDEKLNTLDKIYKYKVVLYDKANVILDTSSVASSVRLDLKPEVGGVNLSWKAKVPWSLVSKNHKFHYIYRDQSDKNDPAAFKLIDSVDVTKNGLRYLDKGKFDGKPLSDKKEYCYYVKTQGGYGNKLLPSPLINSSQESCIQPNDSIPPCKPLDIAFDAKFACEAQLSSKPCGVNDYKNVFRWKINRDASCGDDLKLFKIYYSESGDTANFKEIAKVTSPEYEHRDLKTLAGCYFVTAVDRSGNESKPSNTICNENCPRYILPNVFTPNGDKKNDTFHPFKDVERCPRFVESVLFKVFDATGVEIYQYDSKLNENNILINWDGKNKFGTALPADVYYYSAEVTFAQRKKDNAKKLVKGWVQIIK